MNCRKVSHLLSAYIDGELPGVEHRQIHEHLAGCQECAQEHRGLVQMKRMLASLHMREPSADLPQRILAQVQTQPTFRTSWLDQLNRWVQVQGLKPQSLALAASFALGGIIFASYTIDSVARHDQEIAFQKMTSAEIAHMERAPIVDPTSLTPEFTPGGPLQIGNSQYMQTDYRTNSYYPVSPRPRQPRIFFGSPRSNQAP